jgi:hypothetical protein
MISKNTLYYYINKYNNIMPDTPPAASWYASISSNINSYLKYNYGLRELITASLEYLEEAEEADILSWIKEKINLVFIANENKYNKLFEIETAQTSVLSDKKWTKTTTYSGNDETTLSGSDSTANTGHDTRALTNGGSDTSALTTGGHDTSALTNGGSDTGSETHGGTDTTTNSKPVFDLAVDVNAGSSATQNGETISTSATYGKTENNTTTYGRTENNTYSYGKTENDTTTYGKTTATTYGKKETLKHGKSISESYDGTDDDMKAIKDYKDFWGKWSFIDIVSRDIINEITYSTIF